MTGFELELKAGLGPGGARRLPEALRALDVPELPAQRLVARYFDTPDGALHRAGFALRLRAEDGRMVQTLKADRQAVGGFHRVREADAVVKGRAPRLDALSDQALRAAVEQAVGPAPLGPWFETRVTRRRWRVARAHGLVEVALDRGEILAGRRRETLCEAEFELLEGSPEAVFAVAAALLGDVPVRLDLPNKAERGVALATGHDAHPDRPGRPPAIDPGMTGVGGFEALLGWLAPTLATALHRTLVSDDPEGPHQLRVTLRRLRAALRLYRPLIEADCASDLAMAARELGRIVSPLRDADVLTPRLAAAGEGGLAEALARANAATRRRARAQLGRAQATAMAIRLVGLAAVGGWRGDKADRPADELATAALGKAWKRVTKLGDRFAILPDAERHEFRKDVKKLRYLIELSSFREESREFHSILKKMQQELGELNDIAVLTAWEPRIDPTLRPALDAARAHLLKASRRHHDEAVGRVCRHWRDLRGQDPPWKG